MLLVFSMECLHKQSRGPIKKAVRNRALQFRRKGRTGDAHCNHMAYDVIRRTELMENMEGKKNTESRMPTFQCLIYIVNQPYGHATFFDTVILQ